MSMNTPSRGHLDQSLIVEGKRVRKPVERFGTPTPSGRTSSGPRLEGLGDALSGFEKVAQEINAAEPIELKPLHKLLYGTVGRTATIKSSILEFNGFAFSIGSPAHEKKKKEMAKLSDETLTLMMKLLALEESNVRVNMIISILEFLLLPKRATPPRKRRSTDSASSSSSSKRARESPPAGLQLSEESSGEEEESDESPARPKKRVSFEADHRLVQVGGEEVAALSGEPEMELSGAVKNSIADVIGNCEDVEMTIQITVGWIVNEVLKRHPEEAAHREMVKEHAIRELRAV